MLKSVLVVIASIVAED